MLMDGVSVLAVEVGVARACQVLSVNRCAVYRGRLGAVAAALDAQSVGQRLRHALACSEAEQGRVLEILNSERFAESSPRQVYATLLDEGVYVGSVRTMYRLLAGCDQVRERRRQLPHPSYAKPERLAQRPNELGSGDITTLRGPGKWMCYPL